MFLESYAAANHRSSTLFIRCRWIRERTGSEMNACQRSQQQERKLNFITSVNSECSFFTCGRLCSQHLAACQPQRFCRACICLAHAFGAYVWMPLPTKPSRPTNFKASLSASTEELPWAMLAKGPAWTNTGVPCNNEKGTQTRGGGGG